MFWADKATAHGGIRRSRGYITVNHNDRGNITVAAAISQHPWKYRRNRGKYHSIRGNIAVTAVNITAPV